MKIDIWFNAGFEGQVPKPTFEVHHHFPDKHKVEFLGFLNWAKYTRKKIKVGALPEVQRLLFEDLAASRSTEHTGGRRKKSYE